MKSVDYTVGENLVMLLIFVFTRYRLVTHRQTDGIGYASISHCGTAEHDRSV